MKNRLLSAGTSGQRRRGGGSAVKQRLVLLLLAAALCLCTGCASVIREDSVPESLPAIDPDAGLEKELTASLYYRLNGGSTLLPVKTTLRVRSTEYPELAAIRQLLKEPVSPSAAAALPKGVRLVDLSLESGILYVTFNRAFLSPSLPEATTEELQLSRRLAVYAVVNTLTELGSAARVQILVDLDDQGKGTRVPAYLAGFDDANGGSRLLEPLRFEQSVLTTPESVTADMLCRLRDRDYARAFSLFADLEPEDRQKPDYSLFEAALMELCTVTDWQITGSEIQSDGSCLVTLDLSFVDSELRPCTVQGAQLHLYYESGVYRPGYFSFIDIIRNGSKEQAS